MSGGIYEFDGKKLHGDGREVRMTPTPQPTSYAEICRQECEWCAKGYEKSEANHTHLIDDVPSGPGRWQTCTAPTKDARDRAAGKAD